MKALRWAALLAALVATLLLGGCGSDAPAPAAAPEAPAAANAGETKSLPDWVEVPSIEAKSSLVPLGLNPDKTVEVPPVDKPLQAGWYENSPPPGQAGPAVVLGHIDGNHQKGIFWRLREVKAGDEVRVGTKDGKTLRFTVSKVDQVAKDAFPTDAVYGDTADPELRLITCGGVFDHDTGNYRDNIIAYAKLAS
ncbi:class F sortase [Amycolatopsis minnesotensis]|uniref:Class F sortase n=1 Tax=Amycolatopsis minnesotensis TaxID=337894 RepID=A0ABP5E6Y0_9PSEU